MHRARKQERLAPAASWVNQDKCACGKAGCCHDKKGDLKKGEVPPAVHEVVRSAGQPLEPETRAYLEPRFGQDFSHIRVHRDAAAAHSAKAVNAQAFAQGNHLVFDSGRYDPKTDSGKRLLAHEIAHTIQQQKGGHGSEHAAERDAEHASKQTARIDGGEAPIKINEPSGEKRIQRQPGPNQSQAQGANPPKDEGREKIIAAAQNTTGDPAPRAKTLVNLIVTRYFPEYVRHISGVTFDAKEAHAHADIKEVDAGGGRKTQSATVVVGRNFIDGISDDTLRDRLEELDAAFTHLPADKDPAQPPAGIVWKIVHDKFPSKGGRIAGTAYDANLPMLRTEFGSGKAVGGGVTVSWGGPRVFYGKAFAALPAADQETKVHEELDKIDKWAVETRHLRDDDLKDSDITARIRGLKQADLLDLRDKARAANQSALGEYADSLMSVSTPMEEGLQRDLGGGLKTTIGGVTVEIDLDTVGATSPNALAETPSNIVTDPATIPPFQWDSHNIISQFPGFDPKITVKVQTTYQNIGQRDFKQGYGKGTTAREKELGATSIRYHEGSHGLDIVRFVKAHPFPKFEGKVGDTRADFEQKARDYVRAHAAYARDLQNFTNLQDECPGTTIDQFMSSRDPHWRKICP